MDSYVFDLWIGLPLAMLVLAAAAIILVSIFQATKRKESLKWLESRFPF